MRSLLHSEKAMPALFQYMNETGGFRGTFGGGHEVLARKETRMKRLT